LLEKQAQQMNKLVRKFEEHLESIQGAIDGSLDLRDNYKLYNKIYRFYTKEGVTFTGDTTIDYNMVITYLSEDVSSYELS
tara:strand:+ start:572 stop:811 length:240 start_codon:yes stop_codon:yes gene_type:complete